jgi:broad specificity phosphatase PhoE
MEIVLIRHGKPTGAINPKLSAAGFENWVSNYNLSKIEAGSLPPKELGGSLSSHFIVGSNLPRSIDSACLCVNKEPDLKLKELREMDIPSHKFPFEFKAYTWLIINRILWLLGFSGKVESFKAAKVRARSSAEKLHELATQHGKIAVFGHGLMNKYMAKELNKLGWSSTSKGKKYWGATKLKI